ncbi:hypothetical protein MANES_07G054100v8 [Manihot esculenta]|uniref:Uncharacterized protein n=1 Tax=Manihot esculenta TaxID=3983 RepID=A0A2C9VK26_MANES|nr:hypothetical protein MANES_07G054100v8 [Manihot esculenta]
MTRSFVTPSRSLYSSPLRFILDWWLPASSLGGVF